MAITTNDFNSTRFPGKCYATNPATLEKFKELQRQLNRVAKAKGFGIIAVDGYIGPQTLALYNQTSQMGMTSAASCSDLALRAEGTTVALKAWADSHGAPKAVATPKPPATPAYLPPGASGLTPQAPTASALDAFKNMGLSTTHLLILGGLAGLIAYKKFGKKRR